MSPRPPEPRAVPAGIDPRSVVDPGAVVSAGATVGPSAHVGDAAQIGPGCEVDGGAHVGAGVRLERDVRVQVGAVLVGGPAVPDGAATVVRAGVTVGANSTVGAGVVIEARALVRPGAVVTRSVPPLAIVEGNPASIVGYANVEPQPIDQATTSTVTAAVESTPVRGVTLHRLPVVADLRGKLTVGEFLQQVPFVPQRYFLVFDVPSREVRGEHAHRVCAQFLICVRGSCAVIADDGTRRVEVTLDGPDRGLYLPPMTWGTQYRYTPEAMLLVFASHHYDPADYIREYAEFCEAIARR